MVKKIFPSKLKTGDTLAVIAPSLSGAILSLETMTIANKRFHDLGLRLVFGKHSNEIDEFVSSSIESRIEDLNWAFSDMRINGILTIIGGFNSNQLLKYLDWEVIKNNPKIFCGYSDISALGNAIFAQTGLVTYSGPHYSSFGQLRNFEYTLEYFKKSLFEDGPIDILTSIQWSDDAWYLDQNNCTLMPNQGAYTINPGVASGTILGGNLVTFRTLPGTPYFPDLTDSILFLEEDYESEVQHVDRDLQSLMLLPDFTKVQAVVFGRFQKNSKMTRELLHKLVRTKRELAHIPVVAGVDFGHTSPMITFPIGGTALLHATESTVSIKILSSR